MRGPGQEPLVLPIQSIADEAVLGVPRDAASVCDARDPLGELGIELIETRESTSGKERVAEVVDSALDLALFIGAIRCAGTGREVIMACELKEARMKADMLTNALQHD